ncbi:leukotoxin LktA family filamentous adhesin [Arhodomonas aquaeolei]|uniref:leukotoxin LktA family filamentous adhesin n=1 Tax=Arhodomonas aquaeolei TaxID=2369 RepID=UPI002166C823|nr:leukotoxin LktA family filamentous adhesin [Arhodomonas aquaeolei]MCS4504908.1 leukotoxin LktA family filamentous adhesin [Arhodomonas aquaeolei]
MGDGDTPARGLLAARHYETTSAARRLSALTAAMTAVLVPAVGWAAGNTINLEGSTDTRLDVNGSTTDVTTGTVKGDSGFNSFARFEVGTGNTVNLYVPDGTDNLVNLVHDARARINGTLNGLREGGGVGGNIVFADPHGLVVGASGVVNVGSLVVTTPTGAEMDAMLAAVGDATVDGGAMDERVARLMRGDYDAADGSITIEGQVNADGAISLFGAEAIVAQGASLSAQTDTGYGGGWAVFKSAVNVDGVDAPRGSIVIDARDSVEVNGRLAAMMSDDDGAAVSAGGEVAAGDIEIAGPDVGVGAAAEITTDPGNSEQAGDIRITANAADVCAVCDGSGGTAADVETPGAVGADDGSAATVTVAAGALVNARNAQEASASGDLTITAAASDVQLAGEADASATVTVAGTLKGRDITLDAGSLAEVSPSFLSGVLEITDDASNFSSLYERLQGYGRDSFSGLADAIPSDDPDQLQAVQDMVAVSIARSDAEVTVKGTATLTAERDVSIDADAVRRVDNGADGDFGAYNKAIPFNMGVAYGELGGITRARIDSGATVNVDGDLDVTASSEDTLRQSAEAINQHDAEGNALTTMGFALGVAVTDSETTALVDDGVTLNTANDSDVLVNAFTRQSLTNDVSFSAIGKGATAAPAVAVADYDSTTRAVFRSDLSAGGDLSVQALDLVDAQRNSARAKAGAGYVDWLARDVRETYRLQAPYLDFLTRKINSAFNLAASDGGSGSTPLRLGSAVAIADADHTAIAELGTGGGADVTVDGNVAVQSLQRQANLRNYAVSAVNASAKRKDKAAVGLSVALVYSNTAHDTRAWVGDDSSVTAANIGVGARNAVPLQTDLDDALADMDQWDGYLSLLERAKDVYDAGDALYNLPSQYARASGEADDLAAAGAISVMETDIDAEAWVGNGVTLESSAADPAPWSSVFHREYDDTGALTARWLLSGRVEGTDALTDAEQDWDGGVGIHADNAIERLAVAGNLGPLLFGNSAEGGSVGAGLNIATHDSSATAGMGVNGTVTAPAFDVAASERNLRLLVSPSAGKGKSVAGNGSAAVNDVASDVVAAVDASTTVSAGVVDIGATHDLGQWSAVGAVALSENVGIGAGFALNNVDTDVRAQVGDTAAWRPGWVTARDAGAAATWSVDGLNLGAESRGQNGAFAVAGALARASGNKDSDNTAKRSDDTRSRGDGLIGTITDKAQPALDKLSTWGGNLAGYFSSDGDSKSADNDIQQSDRSLPAKLSGAGSATFNVSNQRTRAALNDVTIAAQAADADPDVDVAALSQIQQYSGSGAGAITMGGGKRDKFSSALSGALAFDWIRGSTRATVSGISADALGGLDVAAISGGDHVAFGAGLAVDTSQSDSLSVAMSGSVGVNGQTTEAAVTASSLTLADDGNTANDVNVRAYDRTRSLLGGGALAGNTGGRGASAGGALTVGTVANSLIAALDGTTVTGADDVTVEAASRSRVLAGALGAAVSGAQGAALSGSGTMVYLGNSVTARVDGGGSTHVDAATLDVAAHSVTGMDDFDPLFAGAAGDSLDGAGLDFTGATLGDLDTTVETEKEDLREDDSTAESQSLFDASLAGEFVIGIAGNLAAGGKASGGGSAGVIYSGSDYTATVSGLAAPGGGHGLTLSGGLDVSAVNGVETVGVAAGAGGSKSAAVLGSATALVERGTVTALVGDADGARLDASTGDADIGASHSGGYYAFSGAFSAASKAATGAAIGVTDVAGSVDAGLEYADLDAGGGLTVDADRSEAIRAAAVSGAVSKSTAIGGALSYNRIGGSVKTTVQDAGITAEDVTLTTAQPDSGSSIWSAAGSVLASGKAAVGGAVSINLTDGTRETRVEDSAIDAGDGTLTLDSAAINEIVSLAVGGQAAQKVAAGGAASFNRIKDSAGVHVEGGTLSAGTLNARVRDGAVDDTGGASRIATLAGNLNGSGSLAVGGGAAVGTIAQTRSVDLIDTGLDVAGTATLSSISSGTVYGLGVAGAVANKAAVAGAAASGSIASANTVTVRRVHGDAGTLDVDADDTSSVYAYAISAGLGSTLGGGQASTVNRIDTATTATITGAALDDQGDVQGLGAGRITIDALADQTIRSAAVGLGGGGKAGIAGSLAVNILDADVTAAIDGGAHVASDGNLGVAARNDNRIQTVGGALSIGGTRVGAAGALGVNLLTSTTEAYIAGADTVVQADGDADNKLTVDAAAIDDAPDPTGWDDASAFDPFSELERDTRGVSGLAVNASSSQQVGSLSAAGAATLPNPSGSAAMAGVGNTSVLGGTTSAYVDAATINGQRGGAAQNVDIAAASNVYSIGYLFSGAVSGIAALSGSLDVTAIDHTTSAYADDATIHAGGDLGIQADSARGAANFVTSASAAAGNGTITMGAIRLAGETTARLRGGTATVRALTIDADDTARMSANVGSAVAGGGSAGGAFALGINETVVDAWLGGEDPDAGQNDGAPPEYVTTTVNAGGAVNVKAHSDTDLVANAAAAAFTAGGGVAGSANVLLARNVTRAGVRGATLRGESGAADSRAGSLSVLAEDDTAVTGNAGSAGVATGPGSVLGASANVVVTNNATRAFVDRSDVRTSGAVNVTAEHTLDAGLFTVNGGAAPGGAAIGGTIGLLLVGPGSPVYSYSDDESDVDAAVDVSAGSELDHDGAGTLSEFDSIGGGSATTMTQRADVAAGADTGGGVFHDSADDNEDKAVNDGAAFSISDALTADNAQETAATISGGSVNAGGAVDVHASERLASSNRAGNVQAGGGSIGAAAGMTFLRSAVIAGVDTGELDASSLTVRADAMDDGDDKAVDVLAATGSAGFAAGLGAAVSVARLENSVTARLGGSADVDDGTITVTAKDTLGVDSEADAASIGGIGAAGASIAVGERRSAVAAEVLAAGTVTAGSLTVTGQGTGTTDVIARSAAGGLGGAANGAVAIGRNLAPPKDDDGNDRASVAASVGDGVNLNADATVKAVYGGGLDVESQGAAVSLGVSMGASLAFADSAVDVAATVGNDVSVRDGDGLTVTATPADNDSADVTATSFSASGGALVGADASAAFAYGTDTVTAGVGTGLGMEGGALSVTATSDGERRAEARGYSVGGALAVGLALARASGETDTTAGLGDGFELGADDSLSDLTVKATANQLNVSDAVAGSGGVVSGNAAAAYTDSRGAARAAVGDGGTVTAEKAEIVSAYNGGYGSRADSVNASLVGVSGAFSDAALTSSSTVHFGDSALHVANGATLRAKSDVSSRHPDDTTVDAASGGVATGQAADHETTLDIATTTEVADGATLSVGEQSNDGSTPDLVLEAVTDLSAAENAVFATNGGFAAGGVASAIDATMDTDVSIGEATLSSRGNISVNTLAFSSVVHDATARTWGGAAATDASATTTVRDNQSITVADDASLTAWGYLTLAPGQAADLGRDNRLTTITTANSLVRGVIAIADASAAADQSSSASVDIGSGATVSAGRDVEITAYNETVNNTVEGLAKGFQAGFIPIEDKDSSRQASSSASLVVDGSVTAGIFDRLDIHIDEDGKLTYNDDAAPFIGREQRFNPTSLIEASNIDSKVAAVIKQGIVDRDVDAWFLDGLFAAGGDVILRADSITGSGGIHANGGPTISVINDSARYLRLGSVTIPDNPGGSVVYTGVADGVDGSVGVDTAGAGDDATVRIRNTMEDTLNNAGYGPALFQEDTVSNVSGTIDISVANGAFASLASVLGRNVSVAVEGPMIVAPQEAEYWSPGQRPSDIWDDYADLPDDVVEVVVYAANAYYGDLLDDYNDDLLNDDEHFTSGGDEYAGESTILFGGCIPGQYDGTATSNCTVGTAESYDVPGGMVTHVMDIDGDGDADRQSHVPVVPTGWSLDKTADSIDDADTGTQTWRGAEAVAIDADIIDINGTISTGRTTERNVVITPELDDWVDLMKNQAGVKSGKGEIPYLYLDYLGDANVDSDEAIRAYYDFGTDQIEIEDVSASGGGYLYLKGKVISSSDQGTIDVESGYGHIDIDNQTAHDLRVNRLGTGDGAVGTVIIADELKDLTAWYRYTQGEGIRKFIADGTDGQSIENAREVAASGSSDSFTPQSGTRWEWSEQATFSRDSDYEDGDDLGGWLGKWKFSDSHDPWRTSEDGHLVRDTSDDSAYWQKSSADFGSNFTWSMTYAYGCPDEVGKTCDNGMDVLDEDLKTRWAYHFPRWGKLEVKRSARVDYPIDIDFSGYDNGRINVDSGGDVILGGGVENPSGSLSVTSRDGAIITGGDAIRTASATLDAQGDIGTANRMLGLDLTGDGALSADSAEGAVRLDLASGASVTRIDAADGAQDVVIHANGALAAGSRDGDAPHIRARDLTVTSAVGGVGSAGSPLVVELVEGDNGDGGAAGGVLDVTAERDIGISDRSGDLWIDSAVSNLGDVYLAAPDGRIRDARRRVDSEAVSRETREAIWKRLKIRDEDGAESYARGRAVPAFEHSIEQAYRSYWQLMRSGRTGSDGFELTDAGLERYRTLLAARGQADDDAAVRAYAADEYQRVTGLFEENLGGDWLSRGAFQSFEADYDYQATDGQVAQLTAGAAWTDDELRRSINVVALETGGGGAVDEAPNVSGRDVTLEAGGSIGEVADPMRIDYQDLLDGSLTDEEIGALGTARAPGDVTIEHDDDGDIAALVVNQTIPMYVDAGGRFDIAAGGSAYIQALSNIRVGTVDVGDDARLLANDSITVADSAPGTVTVGGDITLGASNGSIGDADGAPLALDVAGTLGGVSSSGDVALEWLTGDFGVGRVIVDGSVYLDAVAGDLYRTVADLNVSGQSVTLKADGAIGGAGAPIDVRLTGVDGTLGANSGGDAWLTSPDPLTLGDGEIGGALTLRGDAAVDVAADARFVVDGHFGLTAASTTVGRDGGFTAWEEADFNLGDGDLTFLEDGGMTAWGDLSVVAGDLSLHQDASISVPGATATVTTGDWHFGEDTAFYSDGLTAHMDSLTMAAGSRLNGDDGVTLRVDGDARVATIDVENDAILALDVTGDITAIAGDAPNLVTRSGGRVDVDAGGAIGTADTALAIDAPTFERIDAGGGDAYLTWASDTTGGRIEAAGTVTLNGDQAVDADTVTARTGEVTADLGAFTAGTVSAGDAVTLTTARGLDIGTAHAATSLTADNADGVFALDEAVADAAVLGNTGGDMSLGTVTTRTAGLNVAIAGGQLDAATLDAATGLTVTGTGGSDITIEDARSGGAATLANNVGGAAGGALSVDRIVSGGVLAMDNAQGVFTLDYAEAGAGAAPADPWGVRLTNTGGAMTLGKVISRGHGLQATVTGGDLKAGTLDAGGRLDVTGSGRGDVTIDHAFSATAATVENTRGVLTLGEVVTATALTAGNEHGAFRVDTAEAGTSATLTGTDGPVTLGTVTTGTNQQDDNPAGLAVTVTGGDLDAGMLNAGSRLDVTGEGQGDLAVVRARSGTTMTIDNRGAGEIAFGKAGDSGWALDAGGTLDVTAVDGIAGTGARAGDSVTVNGGRIDAGRLRSVYAPVIVSAGGDVTVGEAVAEAGPLSVTSTAGDLLVGTAYAGTTADFRTGGGRMTVRHAESGGDMRLVNAATDTHADGGDILFGYPADPDVPLDRFDLDAGRDLTIDATGDVTGGNARAARDLAMAGYNLHFGQVRSTGRDVQLTADWNVVGARAVAHRDLGIIAGNRLLMDDARYGGTLSLKAGRDLTVGTGGDIDLTGQVEAGRDMTITSGGHIRLDGASAGRDMRFTAEDDITVAEQLDAGGRMDVVTDGDLSVGTRVEAGGPTTLDVAGDASAASVTTGETLSADIGGSMDVAGAVVADGRARLDVRGDLDVGERIASQADDLDIDVGGRLTTRALEAGSDMDVITGESLSLERAVAGRTATIRAGTADGDAYAPGSDLSIGRLAGSVLTLRSGASVHLDEVVASDAMDIASQYIGIAQGRYTGDDALTLDVAGSQRPAATRVEARFDSPAIVSRWLHSNDTTLTMTGTDLMLEDAAYVDVLRATTGEAAIVVNNLDATYAGADVQLRELDRAFWLTQTGRQTRTDAYVVHSRPGYRVIVPNYYEDHEEEGNVDYTGTSAERHVERQLHETEATEGAAAGPTRVVVPLPALPEFAGGAAGQDAGFVPPVNLQGRPADGGGQGRDGDERTL